MARKAPTCPCRICGKLSKKPRCPSCETKIRRFRCKTAAVALLGGKCVRCGWSGDIAAFEFHHLDPSEKDFGVGAAANKSWKIIKEELKKCQLLCACCHRTEHAEAYRNPAFLAELSRYQGAETFQ